MVALSLHLFLAFFLLEDGLEHSPAVSVLLILEVKLVRGFDSGIVKSLLVACSLPFLDLVDDVIEGVNISDTFLTELAEVLVP